MKLKLALTFMALSLCAAAQTLSTNVPNVTLSGPVGDPNLVNHSGKNVIAVLLVSMPADGKPWGSERLFTHDALGVPDGGSESIGFSRMHRKLGSPIISAKIAAVIFADGEFRGQDSYEAGGVSIPAKFQEHTERAIQSMRRIWQMAKSENWDAIKAESEGSGDGNLFAGRILFERDRPGAGAAKAVDLLAHWGSLPASTWKATGLLNRLLSSPGLEIIAGWFAPLIAHAQNPGYCCVITYPQDSTIDAWHQTIWSYRCNSGFGGSTYPCPDPSNDTDTEGIAALCNASSPNYYMANQITLTREPLIDQAYYPLMSINAGELGGGTNTLQNWGVCNDSVDGWFESYKYYKWCTGSSDPKPRVQYDSTGAHVCGVSPNGYTG